VLFLGGQFILGQVVEHGPASVRDPEYAAKVRRLTDRLAEKPGTPLTLFVGSSRTLNGISPRLLTSPDRVVFNFGMRAAGPYRQGVTLRRLLDEGIWPERVVLEVAPGMLVEAGGKVFEESHLDGARLTASELGQTMAYHGSPLRLAARWCRGRFVPCSALAAELRDHLGLSDSTAAEPVAVSSMDSFGWQLAVEAVDASQRARYEQIAFDGYRPLYTSLKPAPRARRALEDILDLCRTEGIRVHLLVLPESRAFRAMHVPAAREEFEAYLRELQGRWNLPLTSARDWVDDAGFWDGHHMLPGGARQFTLRLAGTVLATR
jgi:hypothetical protein